MSSFVGLFHLDGAPAAPPIIEAMLERLAHRVSPEGARRASVRCQGPIGLGCAVLPTTPEARWELENPDAHQVAGDGLGWIVSDARLDNRAELLGALDAGSQGQKWSDGRLILEAYARWGEASPQRLRGDFAYAIWDARRGRLFCARDRFGVKPFYYALMPGRLFAFACEVKALWCVPELDASVNPAQIADYLVGEFRDKTSTYYLHARRLSPASWVSIAPGQSEVREQIYWELDGETELSLPDNTREKDEKYAALVRAAFGESLRERMRCDGKLAVFLSGGLDSSCVAALGERELGADQKPLTTLSTIFDQFSQCDERQYIEQTLARGAFAPLWMNGDNVSPFEDLERIMWHLDGPSSAPNICSAWQQYKPLQNAGISVVLDGHGGDEIISHGYIRVAELLRQRRFSSAWHELRLMRRHGLMQDSPAFLVWQSLLWHGRDKRGWGRVTRLLGRRSAARAATLDIAAHFKEAKLSIMTPQCQALLDAPPPAPPSSTRAYHAYEINGALQPLALESLDAMSGAHAIETRCPFWEQKLAQLCVSLPAEQKMRQGHNRYVMRRAMQEILAPPVQWRRDKTDFSPQITTLLLEESGPRLEAFCAQWQTAASGLENYLDLEEVRAQWNVLQSAPPGSREAAIPAFTLWKAFTLGLWLATQSPQKK